MNSITCIKLLTPIPASRNSPSLCAERGQGRVKENINERKPYANQSCQEATKKMTPEEKILWSNLRNRKLKGLKFLRQHPIVYDTIRNKPKFFIPDFYCAEKKLIIEVDGKIHEFQKDYDERREEILRNMGLRVIRFKNEEFKDISVVLRKIREFVDSIS